MSLTNDQIFEIASEALRKMLADHGPDFTFPADVIWLNIPPGTDVPSRSRPHQPGRLLRAGLLELTGGYAPAQSPQRAGSPTREYRFGPSLVERPAPVLSAAVAGGPGGHTPSESLAAIQASMDTEGYIVSTAELANFFLAMIVSPLVILSGISGTGKSLLPRKFAKRTKAVFHAIPVQPQWSDNSDLFGYVPTLTPEKYIKGALVDGLLAAESDSSNLVIALLDEMNLAPVEHYFSDFLSITETRFRDGENILSDLLPIDLPAALAGEDEVITKLRGLRLPPNLRIIGTANMDETTHSFSPKVLDRAFTIEFDDPDLTSFSSGSAAGDETFEALAEIIIKNTNAISVLEARPQSQDLFEYVALLLSEIQDILAPAGIKFGYRTRDAILLYLHFWRELKLADIVTGAAALDFCLLQKVLPKISGSGEVLTEALTKLSDWLEAYPNRDRESTGVEAQFAGHLARSRQKLARMIDILKLDGSTRYWGA
jgi:MoxR-like ATPase